MADHVTPLGYVPSQASQRAEELFEELLCTENDDLRTELFQTIQELFAGNTHDPDFAAPLKKFRAKLLEMNEISEHLLKLIGTDTW